MNDEQLEVFKSIFAAQRAINKARLSAMEEVRSMKKPEAPVQKKLAPTLRQHYEPAAEVDWPGLLIVGVVVLFVVVAWVYSMNADFRVMP